MRYTAIQNNRYKIIIRISSFNRTSKKWLDALSDHQTDLRTLPSCLSLCDLKSDGYYKLIAADVLADVAAASADETSVSQRSKLKVYKGTALVSEQLLPGVAAAVENLYIDENIPRVPVIAVAVASSVLFYRNMKPYYKYTLPSLPIDAKEEEIWRKVYKQIDTKYKKLVINYIQPS